MSTSTCTKQSRLSIPFLYVLLKYTKCETGVHNDNEEEEGKGRGANCPRRRVHFQNFLTVVVLLSLDVDDTSQRNHR